jgi:GLPGLI family protein
MKSIKLLFIGLLNVAMLPAVAQKTMNEGKFIFEISYPGSEMSDQQLAMMPTEMVMYIKKDKSRMEMSMGMGMTTVVISDNKAKVATTLMDVMGNKIATKSTEADIEKQNADQGDFKVQITDETKTIAGYTCKKAVVTDNEGESSDIYFCEDIKLEGGNWSQKQFKDINGFPLMYSFKQRGMNMQMTATKIIDEKVDDSKFNIPSDYKEMTQEEMRKMFGGR